VLPLSGALELQVGSQSHQVSKLRAAVIAAGNSHSFAAQGDNAFLVMDLDARRAPWLDKLNPFIDLDPALQQYVRFLAHETAQSGNASADSMVNLLLELLQQRQGIDSSKDQRLDRAISYLQAHLAEPVSIEQLAILACVSVRQLNQLFNQHLGCSAKRYLIRLRIERAKQLLKQSSLPVQQVAEQCGYSSLSAFSDRFRQEAGMSPQNFRQQG